MRENKLNSPFNSRQNEFVLTKILILYRFDLGLIHVLLSPLEHSIVKIKNNNQRSPIEDYDGSRSTLGDPSTQFDLNLRELLKNEEVQNHILDDAELSDQWNSNVYGVVVGFGDDGTWDVLVKIPSKEVPDCFTYVVSGNDLEVVQLSSYPSMDEIFDVLTRWESKVREFEHLIHTDKHSTEVAGALKEGVESPTPLPLRKDPSCDTIGSGTALTVTGSRKINVTHYQV